MEVKMNVKGEMEVLAAGWMKFQLLKDVQWKVVAVATLLEGWWPNRRRWCDLIGGGLAIGGYGDSCYIKINITLYWNKVQAKVEVTNY